MQLILFLCILLKKVIFVKTAAKVMVFVCGITRKIAEEKQLVLDYVIFCLTYFI